MASVPMGISCIVVYKITLTAPVSVLEWFVLTRTVNTFVPARLGV